MSDQASDLRRRKYPRVKESCGVRYRVIEESAAPEKNRSGTARNISGGGMCFSAGRPFEPGAMVALEMSLSELPAPVVSLGRVVWCERAADGAGGYDVGVEFWWIGWADEEAQGRMLKYIHEKLDEMGVDPAGEAP